MKAFVAFLAIMALLAGAAGWAGADEKGAHRGTGIVVALLPSEITLKEGNEFHRMSIDRATRILIASEDRVSQLGIGDYVAEECVPDDKGGVKAVKLTLYRPAWMENASPEN